jgi:hypothetical protein
VGRVTSPFRPFYLSGFWSEKNATEINAGEVLIFIFAIKEQWYPTPELKLAFMLIRQVDTAPGLHKNRLYIYIYIPLITLLCVRPTVSASSSTLTLGGPALRRYSGDVL